MRTISATALALLAGLTFAGAASADEYLTNANRENYAVSAQGFIPGLTSPARTASGEALLPAGAQATSAPKAKVLIQAPQNQFSAPLSDTDPHWGPAQV